MRLNPVHVVAIVIVVILLGALGYLFATRLQARGVADVDAKTYDVCFGSATNRFGAFNKGESYGVFPGNEIWSVEDVYYSWFKDGKSRPASVEAGIRSCPDVLLPHVGLSDVLYVFSYSEDGSSWRGAINDDFPGSVRHLSTEIAQTVGGSMSAPLGAIGELTIDGFSLDLCPGTRSYPDMTRDPGDVKVGDLTCNASEKGHQIRDGAALRVDVYIGWHPGTNDLGAYGYLFVASDEADLRDASARISWTAGGYAIGDTAVVKWETPTATYTECTGEGDGATCTTRPAYFYAVFDMNTNAPIGTTWDRVAVGNRTGSRSFVVTDAMFSRDVATCQNRVRAVLYTELVQVDEADASIAELTGSANRPVVTSVTLSKVDIHEGDSVTVSWAATGNVTKVHVTVWLQGINVVDEDLPGDARDYQFTADRSGFGKVMVTVYDHCSPSLVKTQVFAVGNVTPGICDLFPSIDQCTTENVWAWVIAALAILAAILAFLLVLWIWGKLDPKGQVSPTVRFLGAALVALLVIAVLLGMGAFDGLLTIAGGFR